MSEISAKQKIAFIKSNINRIQGEPKIIMMLELFVLNENALRDTTYNNKNAICVDPDLLSADILTRWYNNIKENVGKS